MPMLRGSQWYCCIIIMTDAICTFSFGVVSRKEEYFHSSQHDLMDGSAQMNGQQMHFMCFYLCTFIFTGYNASVRRALPLFYPRTERLSTLIKPCLTPCALFTYGKTESSALF